MRITKQFTEVYRKKYVEVQYIEPNINWAQNIVPYKANINNNSVDKKMNKERLNGRDRPDLDGNII